MLGDPWLLSTQPAEEVTTWLDESVCSWNRQQTALVWEVNGRGGTNARRGTRWVVGIHLQNDPQEAAS